MKKITAIINDKSIYDVKALLGEIGVVKSVTGKTGLINVNTNEIVGTFDKYEDTKVDSNLFLQRKVVRGNNNKIITFLRIYDAKVQKMVADNWLFLRDICWDYAVDYRICVLQNPETKKYHLFDSNRFKVVPSCFDEAFDDIQLMDASCSYEHFLLVTKDGKRAVYSTKSGFITDFDYDSIEKCGYATVFTTNGKKFFTAGHDENVINSPLFDDISFDNINSSLVYCKNDGCITVYYISSYCCKLLFTLPNFDEVKEMCSYGSLRQKNEYIFLVKKNNKYGLLSGSPSKKNNGVSVVRPLVDVSYSKIEYVNGNYYLYKGNKMGLFKGNYQCSRFVEPIYDKIVGINRSNYYVLSNGGKSTILNIENDKLMLTNSSAIETYMDSIVFEQNGCKGIICDLQGKSGGRIFYGYDDVQYIGECLAYECFLISKDGKKGIIYNNEVFIEPEYESIQISGKRDYKGENIIKSKILYFALKKPQGGYDLMKYYNWGYGGVTNRIEYLATDNIVDIEFYDSIMVCSDKDIHYIYDYYFHFLGKVGRNSKITERVIRKCGREQDVYTINGEHYIYFQSEEEPEGKLLKVCLEDTMVYSSGYESEYGTVVVNSYSKDEHSKKCQELEMIGEKEFVNTLITYFERDINLHEKYPKLVKKINKKR